MTDKWIKFEGSKVVIKIEFNTLILYLVIIAFYTLYILADVYSLKGDIP